MLKERLERWAKVQKIRKDKKGFTLMELIIVMAILAVLVTLALLYYGNVIADAYRNGLLADLNAVDKAIALYENKYSGLPTISSTSGDISTKITETGVTGLPAILSKNGFVTVSEIDGANSNFMSYIKKTTYLLKGNDSGNTRGAGKLYYVESTTDIDTGKATAGGADTITLTDTGKVDDFYIGGIIYITGGAGQGQWRTITSYVAATDVVTVSSNWATPPDNTSTYAIRSLLKAGDLVFLQTATAANLKINDASGNLIYKY